MPPFVCAYEPTHFQAGSEGKILAMIERAAHQQPLFHPDDSGGRRPTPGVTYNELRGRWQVRVVVGGVMAGARRQARGSSGAGGR